MKKLLIVAGMAMSLNVSANLHNFPDGTDMEVFTGKTTIPFKLWSRIGVDSSYTLTVEGYSLGIRDVKTYKVPLLTNGEKRDLQLPVVGERGKSKEYRVCTTADNITQISSTTCSTFLVKRY